MKRYKITIAALVGMALSATAYNPDTVVDMVLESNPGLKTLRAQSRADIMAADADNSLPGPEAEFEHLWGRGGATKWSAGITQSFDWPGLYKARSRVLDNARITTELEYGLEKANLRVEARQLLVRLEYCNQRLAIIDGMVDDMDKLHTSLGQALNHGLITILDYKKSGLELANLRIDRGKIINERNNIVSQLSQMAGRTVDIDDVSEPLTWLGTLNTVEYYTDKAPTCDFQIILASATVHAARLNASVASASLAPGFSVGYRHAKEEGIHYNGVAVGVELPSWGVKRAKAASESSILAAQSDSDRVYTDVMNRIRNDHRIATDLRDRIKVLRAQGVDGSYLSLLNEAYKGGELSVLDYLREQSYYRNSTMAILDLEEQYALTLTSLNRYEQ